MELLLKREIKSPLIKGYGYIFEVYHDPDGLFEACEGKSFDFGNSDENEKYRQRFENEELNVFAVHKMKKCKCCGQAIEEEFEGDWLCGIHAENEEEALEYYLSDYC